MKKKRDINEYHGFEYHSQKGADWRNSASMMTNNLIDNFNRWQIESDFDKEEAIKLRAVAIITRKAIRSEAKEELRDVDDILSIVEKKIEELEEGAEGSEEQGNDQDSSDDDVIEKKTHELRPSFMDIFK